MARGETKQCRGLKSCVVVMSTCRFDQKSPDFKEVIMAGLNIGDRAPDFELPVTMEETWKLSDHLGKKNIVLLFFPLAYSPTCHEELCSIRDGFHEFQDLDAEVVAISVDSPFVLNQWKKELNLPFTLLSDFNRSVCSSYGAKHSFLGPLEGVAKRSVFVIGTDGKVRYVWISEDPGKLPNIEEVRKALES